MGISHASGPYANDAGPPAPSTISYSISNLGDLVVLSVALYQGTANSVSSISGGGVTTWQRATGETSLPDAIIMEVWWGIATSTGSKTATLTYAASASSIFGDLHVDTFTSGGGSATPWRVVTAAGQANGAGSPWPFPQLVSDASTTQLYYGWGNSFSTASAGSTSGFTYNADAGDSDVLTCFNGSLSGSTTYSPSGVESPSTALSFSTGVIFAATGVPVPPPLVISQAVQRAAAW